MRFVSPFYHRLSLTWIAIGISIGIHLIVMCLFSFKYSTPIFKITPPSINIILSSNLQEGAKGLSETPYSDATNTSTSIPPPEISTKSTLSESTKTFLTKPKPILKNKNNSHSQEKSGSHSQKNDTAALGISMGESGYSNEGSGNGRGQTGRGKDAYFSPYVRGSSGINQKPNYPAISRKMGEEGTVYLSVYILASGQVQEVQLKKSSGYRRLDESAIAAVKRWNYIPAKKNNVAINAWHVQAIKFSLTD